MTVTRLMKSALRKCVSVVGYQLVRQDAFSEVAEISQSDIELISFVSPYTMTSRLRMWSTLISVKHVSRNKIPGAFVECGVWRGGQSMLAALQMIKENDFRPIWLFDTFSGMTAPSSLDGRKGVSAMRKYAETRLDEGSEWCRAGIDEVKRNMQRTAFPDHLIHYVQGPVEDTLKSAQAMPQEISILRLDTDWYDSTKVELEVLFPRLSKGGVLLVDDYGHWDGARKAVDEYFEQQGLYPLLQPIDYTGRLYVKL